MFVTNHSRDANRLTRNITTHIRITNFVKKWEHKEYMTVEV